MMGGARHLRSWCWLVGLVLVLPRVVGLGSLRRGPDPALEKLLDRRDSYSAELSRLELQHQDCAAEQEKRTKAVEAMEGQDHFQRVQTEVKALRAAEDEVMSELRAKQRECGATVSMFGVEVLDGLPSASGASPHPAAPAMFKLTAQVPSKMELHRQNDALMVKIVQMQGQVQDCVNDLADLQARAKRAEADANVWKQHLQNTREYSQARIAWMHAEIDHLEAMCNSQEDLSGVKAKLRDLEAQLNR